MPHSSAGSRSPSRGSSTLPQPERLSLDPDVVLATGPDAAAKAAREADTAKSKAALSSVFWSGLLTVLKIVAGLSSNSLGMLSEALHSTLDLVAATITFFAVRLASRPADVRHPFGHGKVESLSALAETLLLVATCAWIIWEGIDRLFFRSATVEPSWWIFGVVLISLAVDISRSAMLRRVAKEHRSQALEADALHFTTDVWSSLVVLIGLGCVVAAGHVEPGSTLHTLLGKADAVAALGVAGIVLGVSWNLARRAVTSLMDGGNDKETLQIREALTDMAPAWQVRRLRVRESGAHYFVDLAVAAPSSLRVSEAHEMTGILEDIITSVLPDAETVVHVEPADGEAALHGDLHAAARHLAALRGLLIHGLALISLDNGLHIFVHIELPPDMPLPDAHARVSAYEADLCSRVGAAHVVSHIEPLHDAKEHTECDAPSVRLTVLETLHLAMLEHPGLSCCHDEDVWRVGTRLSLSFRCRANASVTVAEAHRLASLLEDDLRQRLPRLGQITIHVEPDEDEESEEGMVKG